LERPVEIHIELSGLQGSALPGLMFGTFTHSVVDPAGMSVNEVCHDVMLTARELNRAGNRHHLVHAFCDRIWHAYGQPGTSLLFEIGQLYGWDGNRIGLTLANGNVWDLTFGSQRAVVHADDVISSTATGEAIGFHVDGALVDLNGDAVAVLALSPSRACPSAFLPLELTGDLRPTGGHSNAGVHPNPPTAIEPSGNWGSRTLRELLDEALTPKTQT
jgi:hypothetical protein